ncbi:MAG: hypothetical protein JNN27_20940 [Planctomycetes bacterium]|nr:hypothetical protein [Planctomycetota bacterium]
MFTLDPRTEELLREVAANPSSCLLRVPRREVEEALTRTDYRGLSSTVGLSAAERELLRTARAEVAYWLNVVCFRRLTEDEETRTFTSGVADGDRLFAARSFAEQQLELDWFKASQGASEPEFTTTLDDALQLLSDRKQTAPIEALASLSVRLAPSFSARLYAVQSCLSGDGVGFAMRLAEGLASSGGSRTDRAYALGALGTARYQRNELHHALDAYAAAARLLPSLPEFGLRALAMSVYACDQRAAAYWVDHCQDVPHNRNSITAVVRSVVASRSQSSTVVRRFASELRVHAGSHTQELFDAFALP